MAISIKTTREIELMRIAGEKLSIVLAELEHAIKPGITTKYLGDLGLKTIEKLGGKSNFLNYNGFPSAVCVSVNDEVVHGIPSNDRYLEEGDIVSFDTGLIWKGYHSDAARTFGVGKISDEAQKLIDATRESFFRAMKMVRAGNHLFDISKAIDDFITPLGYGIVEDLVGHGIGVNLHEAPEIPNFKQKRRGPVIEKGMTFAIEPMINMGTKRVEWLEDGWTVVTADGKYSAHYENTVLVTDGEVEILTLRQGQ